MWTQIHTQNLCTTWKSTNTKTKNKEQKMAEITLYKKINTIKEELGKANLKKSGKNKFAGYSYYELGDFIPYLVKLNSSNGVLSVFRFDNETASLDLIDVDSGEKITYTSPMRSAEMKGALDIQKLGAVETYQRRYLYMCAFDIVESDSIDAQKPQDPPSLPELKPNTQAFEKAVERLKSGKSIDDARKVYSISKETEEELKKCITL